MKFDRLGGKVVEARASSSMHGLNYDLHFSPSPDQVSQADIHGARGSLRVWPSSISITDKNAVPLVLWRIARLDVFLYDVSQFCNCLKILLRRVDEKYILQKKPQSKDQISGQGLPAVTSNDILFFSTKNLRVIIY